MLKYSQTYIQECLIPQRRYKFGMLFQNAALFDSFTIFDNVAFPLREHRKLSDDEAALKAHFYQFQMDLLCK